ncbi:MAG: amidohydrolase family protein [Cyclobacteriaceae bacterium]
MKFIHLLISTLSLLISCGTPKHGNYDMVISNVNLIDGTGSAMQSHVNVYIQDGKINAIGTTPVTQTENVIDGTDKYLIPGLFDCHAHTSSYQEDLPRFIHFGITNILCPGGSKTTNEYFSNMRAMGDQDSLPAPRVFHTSQHFTMEGRHPVKTYPGGSWEEGKTVFYLRDTLQIESLVKQVVEYPIVGIKLTIEEGPAPPFVERMPQALVNKVAQEARKNGTEVFAHVSDNTELSMALQAGIKNILHFTGVDLHFKNDKALIDSIYNSDLSWVTTLMLDKSFIYPLHNDWIEEVEKLSLFNPDEVRMLRDPAQVKQAQQMSVLYKEYFGIESIALKAIIEPQVADIKILVENGVNMVMGTDTGNNFIFPGYSLHEEMQLMELGGLAPLDIIKMASFNAAKMLKVLDSQGSLEAGKVADMVLLDKNPLETISNTLSINTVVKNGKIQRRINPSLSLVKK